MTGGLKGGLFLKCRKFPAHDFLIQLIDEQNEKAKGQKADALPGHIEKFPMHQTLRKQSVERGDRDELQRLAIAGSEDAADILEELGT